MPSVDSTPVSLLFDNCIGSLSNVMQGAVKNQIVEWGDVVQTIPISGFQRKPMPSPDQKWKIQQIENIPTFGRLAREGHIEAYTYSELQHESWKRPGSFSAIGMGDLLEGVKFISVDAAVERSFFSQMDISEYIKTERFIEFCKFLLTPNIEKSSEQLETVGRFPDFLINNLKNAKRFRELCSGLSEKQYPDAFHLWTGEVNGISYFLTTDKKFIQVMTKTKKINLPCMPVSPTDLLETLEIYERDPLPFKLNQFINFFGQPE